MTHHAPKMLFKAKKLALFRQKKRFLVMVAPEPLIAPKQCRTRRFESSLLKLGYAALPVTTQAPKSLF